MKTESFIAGLAVGAAAAVLVSKKVLNKLSSSCEGATGFETNALKEAEDAVDTLRNSVESLRSQLSSRIESEQTFAAKCEELKDQVAKQNVEIENLKNICEKQDGCNKKLEEELAEAKAK